MTLSFNFACFWSSNTSSYNLGVMWRWNQMRKSGGHFFPLDLPNGQAWTLNVRKRLVCCQCHQAFLSHFKSQTTHTILLQLTLWWNDQSCQSTKHCVNPWPGPPAPPTRPCHLDILLWSSLAVVTVTGPCICIWCDDCGGPGSTDNQLSWPSKAPPTPASPGQQPAQGD